MSELSGAIPEHLTGVAEELFGDQLFQVQKFADLVAREGDLRGLIGPRELPRLWERHLMNSVLMQSLIPEGARVIDVGSGAGFPGMVLALARPDLQIDLLEPMERRVVWLNDAVEHCGVNNVRVVRGRAGEKPLPVEPAYFVTARAVAELNKLWTWCSSLVQPGGQLLAMKGSGAADEVAAMKKSNVRERARVEKLGHPGLADDTFVVVVPRPA